MGQCVPWEQRSNAKHIARRPKASGRQGQNNTLAYRQSYADEAWCFVYRGEGETCRSPVMGFWRNDPPKFHCKIFHAVADAKLSSGCDEPLELLLVSAFRTLLLLLACFSHTATQW